ncbi:MAG TPA: polysaccharide deacetylase family protein [Thermoleophilaceae bacterium]|nr:polysaccharide deacetylase family protein [Thermoleophilaceae bacterium]
MLGLLRLSSMKAGVSFYWHGIGDPQDDPRTSLAPQMGTDLFRDQIRYLSRHYDLVPASDLPLAATRRRRFARFPLALTFDDDLAAHRESAQPILDEAGAVATFFLCGATLHGPRAFWWQRLSGAPTAQETAVRVKAMTRGERRAFEEQLEREAGAPSPDDGLRASEVGALAAAGHEIGFHTLRHDPLPSLDDEELANALAEGREALAAAAGRALRTVAYPHGDYDSRTPAAAREAGFELGFSTAQRALRAGDDPHELGRLEAPFDSVGHLAFRAARALAARARS